MAILTGPTWIATAQLADYASAILAILINCLLLYCILKKSNKGMGRYKHLMVYFSCQSMTFSVLASFTHMCFHTMGGTFMMFTLKNYLNIPSWGVWILLGLCCISVGYVLLILTAQFIYRYLAMRHNAKAQRYFSGWRIMYLVVSMIVVAVIYGGCGFVGISLTAEKDKMIKETMAVEYNTTADQIHYVAVEYFSRNENNTRIWNYSSVGTALALNFVFSCMVVLIIFFGFKTYRQTQVNTANLSNHERLHRQLFRALLIQTITPTLLIFFPCIIFYVLPIFEFPLGVDANILSITLVLYPVIDPIGVLYIMKNYRNFLKNFFSKFICQCFQGSKDSKSPAKLCKRAVVKETIEMEQRFHII